MKVLVTGGLGFIGSHTVVSLVENGFDVVIVDNLYNSKEEVLQRLESILNVKIPFYKIDCLDKESMEEVFKKENIDGIIHFAGYKAVGESCLKPLMYYRNNLDSTFTLLELMEKYGVKNLVFSSSATVYGVPEHVPLTEDDPVQDATSPYGETKVMIERILKDIHFADPSFNMGILRYFNPIGGHPSGLLGEDPNGIPNNLLPYVSQVAIGKLDYVRVFGDDYPTVDGTGVRDYIHVVDLAEGHVAALKKLEENPGYVVYNLGTGKGTSVLELIHAFEKANGVHVPYKVVGRRPGDVAENYADCTKAANELHWKAKYTVEDACRDAYNFQKKNPEGIK